MLRILPESPSLLWRRGACGQKGLCSHTVSLCVPWAGARPRVSLGRLSALRTDGFTFISLLKQRASGCPGARKDFLRTHRGQKSFFVFSLLFFVILFFLSWAQHRVLGGQGQRELGGQSWRWGWLGRPGQGLQQDGIFLPPGLSGVLFVDSVICSSFAYRLLS